MSRNRRPNPKKNKNARRKRPENRPGSPTDIFGGDELLSVQVIRSASGRHYAESAAIPFPDRETLHIVENVTATDAEQIADRLAAEIKAGAYPADARVTMMGDWVFEGLG
jgi:hypothetical protein